MTPELLALALVALLQLALFLLVAIRANMELGSAWFLSPRDREPDRPLSQGTARLKRAYLNQAEWMPPFAVAVLVRALSAGGTGFTAACAWARLADVPAYALGVDGLRFSGTSGVRPATRTASSRQRRT